MKRKGFTLVELLVVICIIAVLVAILTGLFAGATESARAVKCLANMRNLAMIANAIGIDNDQKLSAGSHDTGGKYGNSGDAKATVLQVAKGWLSWDERNADRSGTHVASESLLASAYTKDLEQRKYCYEHGSFNDYVKGNYDIYKCPTHLGKMKKENPAWSYVMNANVGGGWAWLLAGRMPPGKDSGCTNERRLLFAELPFLGTEGDKPNTSEAPGFKNDCTLQYDGCGTEPEYIGFNHRSSKRMICAHVAFCDGHTEKLIWPSGKGLTKKEVVELTKWLCRGVPISFNGKKYEEVK